MSRQGGVSYFKELIILRQGLVFACRIPLAEQILVAIQEILQTQSLCRVPLVNHLFISTTRITSKAYFCLFPPSSEHGQGSGNRDECWWLGSGSSPYLHWGFAPI